MTMTEFAVTHVRVETDKAFAEVTKDFESQVGRFDPAVTQALVPGSVDAEAVRGRIEAMAGPSGLMLFETTDHGALSSLVGEPRRAVQYTVGKPLVAVEMTRHDLGAGLYAPLRVLISETEAGGSRLEYDLPSSLFGRFGDDRITRVARTLDRKLEALSVRACGAR
jgi:hypothetical protein